VKYLLDTNAVSALMRGDIRVTSKLRDLNRSDVGVPQPVFAEIAFGIARLPSSARKKVLQRRFELLRLELSNAPWSETVSDTFGAIKADLEAKGQLLEDFDIAIAAHAVASGLTLVTHNTRHMRRIRGLDLTDWEMEAWR
jgi:tRNA(fMet)-specific endonuclease VapC